MVNTYRLEFNEKQQQFHLDDGTHEIGTHGWRTITEHCSAIECVVLQCYIESKKKDHVTAIQAKKYLDELKAFWSALLKEGFSIS